jgi:hypothetical protein
MTKKPYRAILIDPEARRITVLEINLTVAALHELIGAETLGNFRLARFDQDGHIDMGWVDDGGLSRGLPIHGFLFPTAKDPVAGKCVIIGANRMGETASCRIPIAILHQDVTWLGLIRPEMTWDHTEHGSRAIVTYSRVKT